MNWNYATTTQIFERSRFTCRLAFRLSTQRKMSFNFRWSKQSFKLDLVTRLFTFQLRIPTAALRDYFLTISHNVFFKQRADKIKNVCML